MRPGDLLFVHGTGAQSRLIQWATKSRYDHVAIVEDDAHVIEALSTGVCRSPMYTLDADHVWCDVGLDDGARQHVLIYARLWIGKRYNWTEIVSIALTRIFGFPLFFDLPGEAICSGLAGESLEHGGVVFPRDGETLSPADLAAFYGVA